MINVSPIGRNCSREERNTYEEFDLKNNVRKNMIAAMEKELGDLNLCYSIGGQISFDVFPKGIYFPFERFIHKSSLINILINHFNLINVYRHCITIGWDKTYCLNYIKEGEYEEIHFFGDKTFPGGNDYEIFTHPRVIGHTTTGPADTIKQCTELFMSTTP